MWTWEFEYANGKKSAELYVPQGVPVKVNLKSADVLHSFYIPAYRVKQDVVPGMETYRLVPARRHRNVRHLLRGVLRAETRLHDVEGRRRPHG